LRGGGAEELHHVTVALLEGPTAPRFDELVTADYKAETAVKLAPREPWGYSARAHIAARVGDREMLDAALADLRRVAPEHPETLAALALGSPRESVWVWLGRLLFAGALVGTLAHALVRRRRARQVAASVGAPAPVVLAAVIGAGLGAGLMVGAGVARAEEPAPPLQQISEFKINTNHPEKGVPSTELQNQKPIQFGYYLQDMLAGAQQAEKREDHSAAAKFYEGLAKAVPSRAYAFGKLAEQYEALGDINDALVTSRKAITLEDPTVGDYERLVRLVANGPQPLSLEARKELMDVAKHVAADKQAGTGGAYIACQIGMALHDRAALEGCTATLQKVAPDEPKTISFEWALAIERGNHGDAERLIERARKAGVPAEGLAAMEAATHSIAPVRFVRAAGWGVVGSALLLGIFFWGRRTLLQRRRAPA
jgi:hypothetical protein